jgi:hypothetical protein
MEKPLLQVQWGKQTAFGTAVAGTAKGMAISDFMMSPVQEDHIAAELRGSLAPGFIAVPTYQAGAGTIAGLVTYEDFPYWIEGLAGIATPTGSGPYVRAYTFPGAPVLSGANMIRLFTFLFGSATDGVYRATGGLLSTLNVKGSQGGPWDFSADWLAQLIDNAGSLAGLSDRAATPVLGAETALYIDAIGGTIGTTEVETTAFSFDLNIDTKRTLRQHLGSLNADTFSHGAKWEATLKLVLEFNATAKALFDAMLTGSTLFQKQVRLKATSGTNILQLDFAGTQDGAPQVFTDLDGVSTVEMQLKGIYASALGSWMKASSTNSVSALP